MAATHFDNWIFLLLVAVAMLFRWLTSVANKASKNSNEKSTSTPPPIPRAPEETDEQRIRKFLEALGQPAGARPPPPIALRTDIPPRPVAPVQPPSAFPRNVLTPRKRQIILSKTTQAPTPVFEVEKRPAQIEPPTEIKAPVEAYAIDTDAKTAAARSETSVAALLRSPSGLRDAIVLREIFGPPRSLQPLDLVGSA